MPLFDIFVNEMGWIMRQRIDYKNLWLSVK